MRAEKNFIINTIFDRRTIAVFLALIGSNFFPAQKVSAESPDTCDRRSATLLITDSSATAEFCDNKGQQSLIINVPGGTRASLPVTTTILFADPTKAQAERAKFMPKSPGVFDEMGKNLKSMIDMYTLICTGVFGLGGLGFAVIKALKWLNAPGPAELPIQQARVKTQDIKCIWDKPPTVEWQGYQPELAGNMKIHPDHRLGGKLYGNVPVQITGLDGKRVVEEIFVNAGSVAGDGFRAGNAMHENHGFFVGLITIFQDWILAHVDSVHPNEISNVHAAQHRATLGGKQNELWAKQAFLWSRIFKI